MDTSVILTPVRIFPSRKDVTNPQLANAHRKENNFLRPSKFSVSPVLFGRWWSFVFCTNSPDDLPRYTFVCFSISFSKMRPSPHSKKRTRDPLPELILDARFIEVVLYAKRCQHQFLRWDANWAIRKVRWMRSNRVNWNCHFYFLEQATCKKIVIFEFHSFDLQSFVHIKGKRIFTLACSLTSKNSRTFWVGFVIILQRLALLENKQ